MSNKPMPMPDARGGGGGARASAGALMMMEYIMGVPGKSGFGASSTADDVTAQVSLHGLTSIVTGATSGIGAEIARALAKRGSCVIIPARNIKAANALRSSILLHAPDADVLVMSLDLSSLSNNAGVFCKTFKRSDDGYEMSFATNHLGHFLLTNLVLERMVESARECGVEGRIVNVSSCLHTWVPNSTGISFHTLNDSNSYVETINYAQSKLANILHAKELARRLKAARAPVTANSIHPGIVKTNIIRDRKCFVTDVILRVASVFLKTIPQGAATACYVATHPDVKGVSGKYFVDCNEAECSRLADDEEEARKLWVFSEKATRIVL